MKKEMNQEMKKARKTNGKIAASVCAAFAALAMVTGLAVFSVSADNETAAKTTTATSVTQNNAVKVNKSQKTQDKNQTANANGKHPGECGYGYNEVNEDSFTGFYFDRSGKKVSLGIVKLEDGTYDCSVTEAGEQGECMVYGFIAKANNNELSYDKGSLNAQKFDEKGRVTENLIVEEGHSGTITRCSVGLVWIDVDGSNYVFINHENR